MKTRYDTKYSADKDCVNSVKVNFIKIRDPKNDIFKFDFFKTTKAYGTLRTQKLCQHIFLGTNCIVDEMHPNNNFVKFSNKYLEL